MHVAQGLGEAVALIAGQAIMDAGTTKLRSNANRIKSGATSAAMSCVMGESLGRADVDPPARCADPQSRFILIEYTSLHQSRFELGFHFGQLLVTAFDKAGDAARRELDSEQFLQQLTGASVGHGLTFYQIGSYGLDTRTILCRGLHPCPEGRSCQMETHRALLFFDPMFGDPEPLDWQIHHLTPLGQCCWLAAQILLAVLAACDRMNEHLIRHLDLLEVMPTVTFLSTRLLAALLPSSWADEQTDRRREANYYCGYLWPAALRE